MKKSADHLNDTAAQKHLNFIIQSSSERTIIDTELNDQIFPWNEGAQRVHGYSLQRFTK